MKRLDLDSPLNSGVLGYLTREQNRELSLQRPEDVKRPYWNLGSHPDIVEHLWDRCAAAMPAECRAVVCGAPALVGPEKGIIFGVALGTEYALRLPAAERELSLAGGAEVVHHYRTVGVTLDLASSFGPDWIFGNFDSREPAWCAAALEYVERS